MLLIHTMSCAGSIAVLFYMMSYVFTRHHLSIVWHKIYLTITIFLFLIPFQRFSMNYGAKLRTVIGVEKLDRKNIEFTNNSHYSILVYNDSVYVHNKWLYILLGLCIIVNVSLILCLAIKYIKMHKLIHTQAVLNETATERMKMLGYPSWVRVYQCEGLGTPVTAGLLHEKIVLPGRPFDSERLKDVLKHEFTHIKVKDNLVKLVLLVVIMLNFYNPIVYYLWYRWNLTAEMYCDSKVLEGKSEQEIRDYANMVVDFAMGKYKEKLPVMGLGKNTNEKQLRERITNMKKPEKIYGTISKVMGTVLIAAAVFASSLTAAAYQPRVVEHMEDEYDNSEILSYFFAEGEELDLVELDKQLKELEQYIVEAGNAFFVDEEGTVYYLDNEADSRSRSTCKHDYVNGTSVKHHKYSDGSCKVDFYSGQMCSKCGDTILGDYLKSSIYPSCPH